MIKSETTINLEYSDAIRKAKEIHDIASDLQKVGKKYEEILVRLSNGWKGENAQNFQNKANRLSGLIRDTASALDTSADNVELIAENTYRAEMNAVRIANKRAYTDGSVGSR